MAYRAGELSERVRIERQVRTPDAGGGYVESWQAFDDNVPALVRPLSGREREHAQQLEAAANYRVVVRNRADLRESDRIVWRGMILNLRFIAYRGPRALFLEIDAEKGVAT